MLWMQSQWPIMTYFFMSFQSHATTRLQRLLTIKENDSVLQHFSNYTYLLSLFPSDLWKMSRVLYLLCWYMAYSMRPNYLPNTGTSNKNLHKFVNFHSVEPKFGGLVGLRWSFPKINVSPLGLDGSLDPGPEPGADVLDLSPGMSAQTLLMEALKALVLGYCLTFPVYFKGSCNVFRSMCPWS